MAATRKKWVTPGLILQVRPRGRRTPNTEPLVSRVGFTVSRKVGNAVARNRARRRLKAAVTEVFETCAKAGFDFVVIGRKGTLNRPYAKLLGDLQTALQRLDASVESATPSNGDT